MLISITLALLAGLLLSACGAEAIITVTPIPPPTVAPTATALGAMPATPLPVPTAAGMAGTPAMQTTTTTLVPSATPRTGAIVATAGNATAAAALTSATLSPIVAGATVAGATAAFPATVVPTPAPVVPVSAAATVAAVAAAPARTAIAAAPASAPTNAAPPTSPVAAPTAAPTRTSGQSGQTAQTGQLRATKTGPLEPHTLPGGVVSIPPGWTISVYAKDLGGVRFMGVRPSDGTLFAADAGGRLLALTDGGDGSGPQTRIFATGLNRPTSVAFYNDWVYVGETNAITRFRAPNNALTPVGSREVVVPDLPGGGNHWTRTVAFGADGRLYVSIGSTCNVCEEQDSRRAAIMVYDPDGKNGRLFATGLRNAVGLAFEPGSGQLWATVNGRDGIGDDTPPDDLRTVNDGTFYGWPYCYAGKTPNPEYRNVAAEKCKDVPPNARSLQAHSAALGLTFGDALAAPQIYRDSIYIAYHGSWNRTLKTGYKVVRIPFVDGKAGQAEDFAVGWLPGGADNPGRVWGRPVGVTVGRDGALYVSDDSTGTIYRLAASGG